MGGWVSNKTGLKSARLQAAGSAAERRAHRRIASSELPEPALIRIPDRPAISLVDLSPGGALLELPFQLRPESGVTHSNSVRPPSC